MSPFCVSIFIFAIVLKCFLYCKVTTKSWEFEQYILLCHLIYITWPFNIYYIAKYYYIMYCPYLDTCFTISPMLWLRRLLRRPGRDGDVTNACTHYNNCSTCSINNRCNAIALMLLLLCVFFVHCSIGMVHMKVNLVL